MYYTAALYYYYCTHMNTHTHTHMNTHTHTHMHTHTTLMPKVGKHISSQPIALFLYLAFLYYFFHSRCH